MNWNRFALCLLVCISFWPCDPSAVALGAADGSPADPNIRFIGRWDRRDPEIAHSYWSNTYLRTGFNGTTVKVKIAGRGDMMVSIDGEAVRVLSGLNIIDLTPKPLRAGEHTLLIAANSQNGEVVFKGLMLDAGATTLPVPAKPLIEFIGDSITACEGKGGVPTDNYAWLTGEALHCDHTQIAFSGKGLQTGWGALPDKTGFDDYYFRLMNCNHKDTTQWNFSTYTPQLVVVNLGTNEVKDGQRAPDVEFAVAYAKFLRAIRAKFPLAEMVGLRPFSGFQADGIRRAVDDLNSGGDRQVHYVDTTGWLNLDPATGKLDKEDSSDGLHPSVKGHAKLAVHLVEALKPILTSRNESKTNGAKRRLP